MSVQADITAFAKKTGLTGALIVRKLGLQAFVGILRRSPVDEGRFRASHRISANAADLSVEPPLATPTGLPRKSSSDLGAPPVGAEIARSLRPLATLRWGDSVHITNALPYAQRLEDGWSQQTPGPKGIYGATFAELKQSLGVTVAAAKSEADRGGAS